MIAAIKKSILKLNKKAPKAEKSCCCSKNSKKSCGEDKKPTMKELELCQAIVD